MGLKALVARREKILHHGEGWCRAHGKVSQGPKGAAVVREQSAGIRAAGRDKDETVGTAVPHLPASES